MEEFMYEPMRALTKAEKDAIISRLKEHIDEEGQARVGWAISMVMKNIPVRDNLRGQNIQPNHLSKIAVAMEGLGYRKEPRGGNYPHDWLISKDPSKRFFWDRHPRTFEFVKSLIFLAIGALVTHLLKEETSSKAQEKPLLIIGDTTGTHPIKSDTAPLSRPKTFGKDSSKLSTLSGLDETPMQPL